MKSKLYKPLISVLALLLLLSSCGKEAIETADNETSGSAVTEEEVKEEVYSYELPDLEDGTFTVLNCVDNLWSGMNNAIDFEKETGDSVSDAIYSRARKAENDMKFKLEVIKDADPGNLTLMHRQSVLANESAYDIVYNFLSWAGNTPLSGEYELNLYDIDTLNMDEAWWNSSYIEAATLGGNKLYSSIDYINMMGYSYANVLYINKDMANNLSLEMPYDTIRSGKWTYDVMNDYMKAAVTLNGDENFSINKDGSCVYGFGVQHKEGTMSLLNGSGERFSTLDSDGMPVLNTELNRFSDVYDKLSSMLSEPGFLVMYNTADLSSKTIFMNQRAMFWTGSLGISMGQLRDAEFEYGVIPFPKYDENQDNYYTMVSEYTLSVSIPKSSANPERTGAVVDYMSYLGYKDIIPVLQNALCYKGMRDEDSIEMFNEILSSLSTDIGYMFGWTMDLTSDISQNIASGNSNFMSKYESNKSAMENKISATLEAMGLAQ